MHKTKSITIVDLACGNLKTFPDSIGVDIIPKGILIRQIHGDSPSKADVQADVFQPLPFEEGSIDICIARHILEHTSDTISALRNWLKPLKKGGKLVISVPNERLIDSIPMNPEHKSSFIPESFNVLILAVGGMKILEMWDSENQISFTAIMEKI